MLGLTFLYIYLRAYVDDLSEWLERYLYSRLLY